MVGLKVEKPLNRAFALTFALIIIVWMAWQMVMAFEGGQIPADIHPAIMVLVIYSTLMIGYPIIVFELLLEVRRPTLDLRLHRNWRWMAAGAFLLGIFALINVIQAFQEGQTLGNWLLGSLAMETSSFALLFGILFMTRSPRSGSTTAPRLSTETSGLKRSRSSGSGGTSPPSWSSSSARSGC